jgi:hypothetical protein
MAQGETQKSKASDKGLMSVSLDFDEHWILADEQR